MNRIELSTIGGNVSLGGGGRAPKPEDCMKDCIAWYSPKRQGITNEYLQDHYLDDDAVLQDLSGNGNHIALHNMEGEEGGGCVNDDGDLVFDGVDDYGLSGEVFSFGDKNCVAQNIFDNNGDTIPSGMSNIHQFGIYSKTLNYYPYLLIKRATSGQTLGFSGVGNSMPIRVKSQQYTIVYNLINNECPYVIVGSANVQFQPSSSMTVFESTEEKNPLRLASYGQIYSSIIFREMLFFRRNLTHEEAQWVYDNILTTDNNNQNS